VLERVAAGEIPKEDLRRWIEPKIARADLSALSIAPPPLFRGVPFFIKTMCWARAVWAGRFEPVHTAARPAIGEL